MPSIAPSEQPDLKQLHIAVGVIRDASGRILISQRRPGTAGEGLWEFPGGKCEAGENIEAALHRELFEELGIQAQAARPLIRIRHQYPDRHVLLDTWEVSAWAGEARGVEGQNIAWVAADELPEWPLLPANGPITQAACLPDRYLVTPSPVADETDLLAALAAALQQGTRLIRLRAPELADSDYARLARQCLALCQPAGARLMLDRDCGFTATEPGLGLQLTAARLMAMNERPTNVDLLAASCHNCEELRKAEAMQCDFVVLGPVTPTPSHPYAEPLTWVKAAALIDEANLPVYCIGGLSVTQIAQAQAAGAQGIAAIRGLWPTL